MTGTSGMSQELRASVVIPAHNEGRVIERCLDALLSGPAPGTLDVVVVCNGCHDDTHLRAQRSGVRVLELNEASKAAALRAGDLAARAFPRIYLDADVVLSGSAAFRVAECLENGALAARPPLIYDSSHSTAPVRNYYRARSRVPAVLRSLWGAGVYGLSDAGRQRFEEFPDLTSDDLWLDRQFDPNEVKIVDCEPVVVAVPRRSRDLITVLRRTYRGKAEHQPTHGHDARARSTTRSVLIDLWSLAGSNPRAALDAATYLAFAVGARLALIVNPPRGSGSHQWERDESSRAG